MAFFTINVKMLVVGVVVGLGALGEEQRPLVHLLVVYHIATGVHAVVIGGGIDRAWRDFRLHGFVHGEVVVAVEAVATPKRRLNG